MITIMLYSVVGGTLAILATGDLANISSRFLRLVGVFMFAIGCGMLAWAVRSGVLRPDAPDLWPSILLTIATVSAGLLLVLAPAHTRIANLLRSICAVGGIAALAAASLAAISSMPADTTTPLSSTAVAIGQALSACLLGAITVAWLLGHAYLTATKMTIAPLRHFSRVVSWAVGLRIGFLLVGLAVASLGESSSDQGIWVILANGWLIASLRIGVGLLGLAAFAYMVEDCVKLRATQSATGILYFGFLLALIGELANLQFVSQYGWPL